VKDAPKKEDSLVKQETEWNANKKEEAKPSNEESPKVENQRRGSYSTGA
jgi:hypothetical protein